MTRNRWQINISNDARNDLLRIRTNQRARIRQVLDGALAHEPFTQTCHQKPCRDVPSQFAHLGVPVWKLTVDPYRVLYCLDAAGVLTVLVLEIFKKGRKTMEESL